MAASYFFYDLETSGFDARESRIMQFAGIRTDTELQPVGELVNVMVKMTPDTVPSPDAVMITGITPQATIADGVTEAEFLKMFHDEVVQPGTIFMGFNSVRFDDEFMRYLHYRNFYDPYEWQYCDDCSKWDLLDVLRMTRALRPEGIEWPFTEDGKPTNRLELMTKLNGIDHYAAHDALSDVYATIAVAKLIRDKQPKLFEYLLNCRHKKEVEKLVCGQGKPFVYSSGKFPAETQKTTVAVKVAESPLPGGCLVYDLRHDPTEFMEMGVEELAKRLEWTRDENAPKRLPAKELKFNRCPAVAPLQVLTSDPASMERIGLDQATIRKNLQLVLSDTSWMERVGAAYKLKNERAKDQWAKSEDAESQLYDNFLNNGDKPVARAIRAAKPEDLMDFANRLQDGRLKQMLPRYKARNFPDSLSDDERRGWEEYCRQRMVDGGQQSRLAKFFERLQELAATADSDQRFLLEELQLYGQSIMPAYDAE